MCLLSMIVYNDIKSLAMYVSEIFSVVVIIDCCNIPLGCTCLIVVIKLSDDV